MQKNEDATSKPIEISNSDDKSISRILSKEAFQFNDSKDSVKSNKKRKPCERSKGISCSYFISS